MIGGALVDTGPLIALIDRRDQHHRWTRDRFNEILPPLLTCEPVLTEACFLARRIPNGLPALLALFDQGVCALSFALQPNWSNVVGCMRRYGDLPCSLADACLVRMSELTPQNVIFTLDGHFRIYRRNRRQRLSLMIPPDA